MCEIRRYHDKNGLRDEQLAEARESPYQFQERFTDSCEFVYQYLVQYSPDQRNKWLQQHCPELLDAVNSNEEFQKKFCKDLYSFISTFDFATFLPLIEPQEEGTDTEHKPSIHFELSMLDNLRDIVLAAKLDTRLFIKSPSQLSQSDQLKLLDGIDIDAINSLIRDCTAVEIGLDGCLASIHTAILCSFLRQLKQRQKMWLDDWQYNPKTREAQFEIKPYRYTRCMSCNCKFDPSTGRNASCVRAQDMIARSAMLPVRYIRHHIENTFTHLDDYWRPNRSYQQLSQGADPEPVYTGVRAYDTFIDSCFFLE